jgi:hypothetical protein
MGRYSLLHLFLRRDKIRRGLQVIMLGDFLKTAASIHPTGQAGEFAGSKLVERCFLKSVRPLWQMLVCRLE